ncbi:hypothetical protein F2P56_019178 [Juglans regia]|uniref:PGG domain-containing protein n=1 Tax=Juglans regia TaxID=51240 RepID=A0A833XB64_JUGRE|nr:hypothetical protein F2P56_019178 [Juglans regia]
MEYSIVQGSSPEEGKTLFEMAMKGKWSEVVDTCTENPFLLSAGGITRTKDTLLHLAVSEGQEKTVLEITKVISELPISKEFVGRRNDGGNTALHLAAVVGNVAMCKCLAGIDSSLIVARNEDGETPLSLAVLFGKNQAFICLTQMLMLDKERFSHSKTMKYGTHGYTILHYAINGDHYDLALDIIKLYGERGYNVNVANEEGITPFHLLAGKPSAFPSGSLLLLGWCKTIIYHCMIVDEHDVEQNHDHPIERNYRACVNFLLLFRNLVRLIVAIRCKVREQRDEESPETQPENPELRTQNGAWKHRFSPAIYGLFYKIFKLANRTMVIVLIALGIPTIRKIYEEKKKHKLSILIMNELLRSTVDEVYEYYYRGSKKALHPSDTATVDPDEIDPYLDEDDTQTETPILIAARNGISEIVEKILELFPIAIHDMNEENKNVMLLAVQYRQPHVFQILLQKNIMIRDRVLRVVDKSGNNAAHLAAELGAYRPWLIPGEALQMQWEMKWFEFVTQNIPSNLLTRCNNDGKTPEELFIENHKQLVKDGGKWLIKTSESYSLVAALIATVAFASSTAVPGGVKEDNGSPTLENRTPFHLFAISSLIALCFSVTALVTFLSILTSRNKEKDFGKDLPTKLLIGLTSLFFSIAAVLITFCSGHFFVIDEKLKYVAYPVYAATCLPVTFFAVMQFPLYFDLIESTFKKVPRRSYKASVLI